MHLVWTKIIWLKVIIAKDAINHNPMQIGQICDL